MRPSNSSNMRNQAGYTIVELVVALAIAAVLALYAAAQAVKDSEEVLATGAGEYIAQVTAGAEQHMLLNWEAYAKAEDVAGVANDLQPTLTELRSLGRLNPGFPVGPGSVPTRQSLSVNIIRTNCPGASCSLKALVCTTTPVTLGGNDVRFDLASTMVASMKGIGGQSLTNSGSIIRGPAMSEPNPLGNVEGIVCGSSGVDTALYQKYLTLNDDRDPNLQGDLTVAKNVNVGGDMSVAGNTTLNNVTITGDLNSGGDLNVGTCAKILKATGRAGFGCADPDNVPAGYTGGVRSPDVVANSNVLASDAPGAFTGSNGKFAIMTVNGAEAEIRTSGRAAANRLTPTGQYAPGSACVAVDEGSIARNSAASGLVVCNNLRWKTLATTAAPGDTCSVNGSTATAENGLQMVCVNNTYVGLDTIIKDAKPGVGCTQPGTTAIDTSANNETLICRSNLAGGTLRYMRLRDVTQHMVFVSAMEVSDGTVVSHPTCDAASGQTALPIIQMIPKVYSTSDGGVAIYAVTSGASWIARLRNGAGNVLTGSPAATAVAQVFCYFP